MFSNFNAEFVLLLNCEKKKLKHQIQTQFCQVLILSEASNSDISCSHTLKKFSAAA
jgi:hypothetical protein